MFVGGTPFPESKKIVLIPYYIVIGINCKETPPKHKMNFEDLPLVYLWELVKWSPDFCMLCHRLSKTIYLATKTVKLECCKTIPPKRTELERYMTDPNHPFGCVAFSNRLNFFFTSRLWSKASQKESLDIKGTFSTPNNCIRLLTVRSHYAIDKFCFDQTSKYFQYSSIQKRWNDETLVKFFGLTNYDTSIRTSFKSVLISDLSNDDVCLDCQTVFNILSTRKTFPLELCRQQTTKYFDSCLNKLQEISRQFMYVYVNHLLLGLDSIHNDLLCSVNIKIDLDAQKILQMTDQVRQKITSLQ